MLLHELVTTDKIVKAKGTPQFPSDPLGEGLFARVYPGRKTNTVIKVADVRSPDDPYIQFVRTAMENQDNPFFPRIYNAKLYQQENGQQPYRGARSRGYTFVVEMEKLTPLGDPKIHDAIPHLFRQIGIDVDEMVADTGERMGSAETATSTFTFKMLDHFEHPSGRRELRRYSSNDHFIEALDEFEQLLKHGGRPDVHAHNMMARLTGVGPQLVFTDPVAP